jgi:nucleotide-binding universal stress UspA family protein
MYPRILVPVDGSPTSQRGVGEAIAVAKQLGSSLVFLHVVEYYPVMIEMATATTWDHIAEGLRDTGRKVLEAAHEQAKAQGVDSEAVLEDLAAMRVADAIVDAAATHRCGLIVIGTHGRRGVGRLVMGSDAELVVRLSPVPVLMVRLPDVVGSERATDKG